MARRRLRRKQLARLNASPYQHLTVLVPLGLFLAYTAGGLKTKCPACRKRSKLGATACHHCMRSIVRA